jgi:hypothetical protein
MLTLMSSLLAIVEDRFGDAIVLMDGDSFQDPEGRFLLARHLAYVDRSEQALEMIVKAISDGFVCAPQTLRNDPWLGSVRAHPGFAGLLRSSEDLVESARRSWRAWQTR